LVAQCGLLERTARRGPHPCRRPHPASPFPINMAVGSQDVTLS
jgi:hypothetical protein